MNKFLEANLKTISLPLGSMVFLVIVFLFGGNFAFERIKTLSSELEEARATTATLQDKASSLETTQQQVTNFADSLVSALPDKNSSLLLISQLRTLATENSIILQNLKVGSEVKEAQIAHVDVTFDIEGQSTSLINFILQTRGIAPLNKVTRVRINSSGETSRANVTIGSYYAEFPTKIPAVSDPLQKITADEEKTLAQIASLRRPQFLLLTPSLQIEKVDPFGGI